MNASNPYRSLKTCTHRRAQRPPAVARTALRYPTIAARFRGKDTEHAMQTMLSNKLTLA